MTSHRSSGPACTPEIRGPTGPSAGRTSTTGTIQAGIGAGESAIVFTSGTASAYVSTEVINAPSSPGGRSTTADERMPRAPSIEFIRVRLRHGSAQPSRPKTGCARYVSLMSAARAISADGDGLIAWPFQLGYDFPAQQADRFEVVSINKRDEVLHPKRHQRSVSLDQVAGRAGDQACAEIL